MVRRAFSIRGTCISPRRWEHRPGKPASLVVKTLGSAEVSFPLTNRVNLPEYAEIILQDIVVDDQQDFVL